MLRSNRISLFFARNAVFVGLVGLIAFFTYFNSNFLSVGNARNIVLQSAELGIIAIPLAFLLISGAVDLSVGSVASAAAVTAGLVMAQTQDMYLGMFAGLTLGLVAGAINGVLVAFLKLNAIVVTLGFLSVWGGFAQLVTGGRTVQRSQLPEDYRALGTLTVVGIPIQIVLLLVVVTLGWWVLNHTRVGKEALAIGGNERAAHLMGINVTLRRFQLFVVSGGAAAVAGILLSAKVQAATPLIGAGMELQALIVVLLGGVAFAGGAGRISGVVAGLLFFKVLSNGLVFLQASAFLQTILVGATLVVAVALDSSLQQLLRRAWQKDDPKVNEKPLPEK
jgi:ribose/xylose/arabinose/galactoside ABC-type transport system permease subunit